MDSSVIPMCVDSDGKLIRTDLLFESTLALLKRNAPYLFVLPSWPLGGRISYTNSLIAVLV